MIQLTINDIKVEVEANTTILDAARSVGIYIPTLCAYKGLSPLGACRFCVVEGEGERKPVASCHVPAQNGMVVRTDTPKLWELRKLMVELILATHPLDCPICDKGGECELQDITHLFEMDRHLEKDPDAESIAGVIAVCPVGSLLDHPFKLHSRRPWDLTKTQTTCPHCSDGCQLVLNTAHEEIYRVTAVSETDFSLGHPCLRGRFGYGFINHPSRLKAPLKKVGAVHKEASWDDALARAASNIKDTKEKYGPEAVWGIASPRLTNEEHLALASLFSSMGGGGNVILSSGVGNTAISGVREVMGEGYSIPLTYIDNSDLIIVIGSDLTETNPFLANRISRTARLKESRSVVINPRKIELCKSSWRWLAPKPGTEAALLTWIGKRVGAGLKSASTADWLNAL